MKNWILVFSRAKMQSYSRIERNSYLSVCAEVEQAPCPGRLLGDSVARWPLRLWTCRRASATGHAGCPGRIAWGLAGLAGIMRAHQRVNRRRCIHCAGYYAHSLNHDHRRHDFRAQRFFSRFSWAMDFYLRQQDSARLSLCSPLVPRR